MSRVHERQPGRALLSAALILMLILAACSGPDDFTDTAETPTEVATTVPLSDASPTPSRTATAEITPTADGANETPAVETPDAATPLVEPTPEATNTPEVERTATPEAETTPTEEALGGMDSLPRLEELPGSGYIVADQGERTDEQLARAYADATAHLLRLDEWGFRQHVYREFTRQGAEDDPAPTYVLGTVNVYGSLEQADLAFQWLEDLQLNQGARAAEAPELGEATVAITIATAQGVPTASVYVRSGSSTYIYYAEGGDPLPAVIAIAETVFERISDAGRRAELSWPS